MMSNLALSTKVMLCSLRHESEWSGLEIRNKITSCIISNVVDSFVGHTYQRRKRSNKPE